MKGRRSIVTEDDTRGRQKGDRCFYCPAALGAEHGEQCPCRRRTIVVRTVVEHVVLVPQFWDQGLIEFSRNQSSSCADNILAELAHLSEYVHREDEGPQRPPCFCGRIESTYVREASAEDEFRSGVFAVEEESPKDLEEAQTRDLAVREADA